jgi:hypothetical protein
LSVGDRIVLTTNAGRRRQLVRRVERALGVSVQPIEAWSQIAGQPPDALSTMAIGLSAGLPVRD